MENPEMKTDTRRQLLAVPSTDLFGYFAAHAPEAPVWFEHKEWNEEVVKPSGPPGMVRFGFERRKEDPMDYLVRWRMEYARAMVAAVQADQADLSDRIDAMIEACVPGGQTCDPQHVADAIRDYLANGGGSDE